MTGSTTLVLAMAVAIAVLMRRSYRYFGRRSKNDGALARVARPTESGSPRLAGESPELNRFEVQLHEMSREIEARLDTKMRALGVLTREAQRAIERLEGLVAAGHGVDCEAASGRDEVDERGSDAISTDPSVAEVFALDARGLSAVTIAHQLHRSLAEVEAVIGGRAHPGERRALG